MTQIEVRYEPGDEDWVFATLSDGKRSWIAVF